MKFNTLCLIYIVIFFISCGTQRGAAYSNYLQNPGDTSGKRLILPEPVIHNGDLLSIKVYSTSARPDLTDAPYNLPEQTVAGSSTLSATAGFLVDENGNIEYPRIGRLHINGLTKLQLADTIKKRLAEELTNPSVIVRFLNYRITVLGEVRNPSSFTPPTERITILEALGFSGDVTDYGNKRRVQVAREKNGEMEVGYIDLTSKDMFSSPYYRLQQNDVVFVEQNRRKVELQEQQVVAQRLGIITSIVSLLVIVYSIVRR